MLYQVHYAMSRIPTHNLSGARYRKHRNINEHVQNVVVNQTTTV